MTTILMLTTCFLQAKQKRQVQTANKFSTFTNMMIRAMTFHMILDMEPMETDTNTTILSTIMTTPKLEHQDQDLQKENRNRKKKQNQQGLSMAKILEEFFQKLRTEEVDQVLYPFRMEAPQI